MFYHLLHTTARTYSRSCFLDREHFFQHPLNVSKTIQFLFPTVKYAYQEVFPVLKLYISVFVCVCARACVHVHTKMSPLLSVFLTVVSATIRKKSYENVHWKKWDDETRVVVSK